MSTLTQSDLEFFQRNGYVIARNVVPPENLTAVINALWQFLGMDPNNPDDWYREPHRPNSMVELYQHQALWDNRQHPSVHETFAQIFGTPKLWVSEDRVSMKPPMNPKYPAYNHAGFIHWDVNTAQWPVPFGVQGVLCLTDTTADMGGFRCAPGFYAEVEAWARTQPIDRNPYTPDLKTLPKHVNVVPIPANAGDLIVWNTLTLHGIGLNKSNRPRLAQYISMHLVPAHPAQREAEREKRIHRWRNRLKPDGAWALGDPRHWEELHGTTAVLTPLGRKLLGADDW